MSDETAQSVGLNTIKLRHSPNCLTIVLDRPEVRNAISTQMLDEMSDALAHAASQPSVRGIVLTGGVNYFSSGADLAGSNQVDESWNRLAYLKHRHAFCATLESLDKPVLAAIEGFCITAGLELALACDLRIAGRDATFAITSSRIGTVAGLGATQRLPRQVGMANGLEMLFSAQRIPADNALRIGLVNRVVDAGQALDTAQVLISQLPERPAGEWSLLKHQYRYGSYI